VYSDLNCSFAHVAVHRLHETRERLGLAGKLYFDHRLATRSGVVSLTAGPMPYDSADQPPRADT
jgi:hypothetical protein